MQQKRIGRLIYKLHSKDLKAHQWQLRLPLSDALRTNAESVVTINDSQCLRFIDEINGISDVTIQAKALQREIRQLKRMPKSKETMRKIGACYDRLYSIQFMRDYVCVIMDNMKDYDRANKGFSINYGVVEGCEQERVIHYRRLLGTNGGIKNSTIVYVNREIYSELKKRLDNGRDMAKELVPAKLEAYQALICSGSIPLPKPNGIIVVPDCITRFRERVIRITDEGEGEPAMTEEDNFEFEHNNSDGYGLMLPAYSRRVNKYLTGDGEHTIAGMNTRYAWTKGMVYTFDFLKFAERVSGTYVLTDVWGQQRDVRDAEVILTESMLKLWDAYPSWEAYERNCDENHYQFSVTKTTPQNLEHVRDMNYQFLQSYDFTDEELQDLCQPTIDEIKDVIGLDYRKSIVFLSGFGLNERNAWSDMVPDVAKALMVNPNMIKDPFIRRKLYNAIKTRITAAKRGCIRVHGNYSMISGDPYALAQSMFGMEVTGLLGIGEVYHQYWIDHGADEIVCFRAPMTVHNNIRRMKLNKSDRAYDWFQYIDTALIYNAWDSACEAMNGADFDGDSNLCTDNPILLRKTMNSPTIVCVQRRAEKCIPTEDDIIKANKLAFNDDIGKITNYVTSMFDVQAGFERGTPEYEELDYRIKCGQLYQQNTIDRAKGIIANPMPNYWYDARACRVRDGDDDNTIKQKKHWLKLVANRKPYFMIYVYPSLRKEYKQYERTNRDHAILHFGKYGVQNLEDVMRLETPSQEVQAFISYYFQSAIVGKHDCTMNRLSKLMEHHLDGVSKSIHRILTEKEPFDYHAMQSDGSYSNQDYYHVVNVYCRYLSLAQKRNIQMETEKIDSFDLYMQHLDSIAYFQSECYRECTSEDELCNIVLDMCYRTEKSKQFAWDICAPIMLGNLLDRANGIYYYPELVNGDDAYDFMYGGRPFCMRKMQVEGVTDDYTE